MWYPRNLPRWAFLAAGAALGLGLAPLALAKPIDFVVAGAPRDLVADRDYLNLFTLLRQNGITGFFPTFQYQEVPQARSYGYESDFVPPCSPNDRAFKALSSGIKLILPAELVYPDPSIFSKPMSANDPLKQIIACAGRSNIAGISNYDEAAFQGVSLSDVKAFYDHVKAIDETLPVLMVHGPLVADRSEFNTSSKRRTYLDKVVEYSKSADVVGFDVYPVPALVAKMGTPSSNGQIETSDKAIRDYAIWLKSALPGKRKLMVLQGFSYADLYERNYLESNVPIDLRAVIQAPSRSELDVMVKQAQADGVDMIVWWGQAALRTSHQPPWPDILWLGRQYGH